DRLVDARSTAKGRVAAHAALRADGALTLVLVNKTASATRIAISIDGFCATRGEERTLTGDDLSSKTFRINDAELTLDAVDHAGIPPRLLPSESLLDVTLPPTSVRLIVYHP